MHLAWNCHAAKFTKRTWTLGETRSGLSDHSVAHNLGQFGLWCVLFLWSGPCSLVQAGFECALTLPKPSKCWGYPGMLHGRLLGKLLELISPSRINSRWWLSALCTALCPLPARCHIPGLAFILYCKLGQIDTRWRATEKKRWELLTFASWVRSYLLKYWKQAEDRVTKAWLLCS